MKKIKQQDMQAVEENNIPNIDLQERDQLLQSDQWVIFDTDKFYSKIHNVLREASIEKENIIIIKEYRQEIKNERNSKTPIIMSRSQSKNIKSANIKAITPKLYYLPKPELDDSNYQRKKNEFGLFYATLFHSFDGVLTCQNQQIFRVVQHSKKTSDKNYSKLISQAQIQEKEKKNEYAESVSEDESPDSPQLKNGTVARPTKKFTSGLEERVNKARELTQSQQKQKPQQQTQQTKKKENVQKQLFSVDEEDQDEEIPFDSTNSQILKLQEQNELLIEMISQLSNTVNQISERLDDVVPAKKKTKLNPKQTKKNSKKGGKKMAIEDQTEVDDEDDE